MCLLRHKEDDDEEDRDKKSVVSAPILSEVAQVVIFGRQRKKCRSC